MDTIAIVDYGMGNLRSVAKAVEHVAQGEIVRVTSSPEELARASRVIVPGQGAMPDCMRELEARGLKQAVIEAAASKPFLGICIGLQMLFERSEEGDVPGLGVLPGEVVRFPEEALASESGRLKVPHMGWNQVEQTRAHPLFSGIDQGARFYFVHSYVVRPAQPECVLARTVHGITFTSAVARDNIVAVQFHPEKSAAAGLTLLANFIRWNP